MTTLFTLSKSWHHSTWLFEQLCFAQAGDSIVLLQDAVLALSNPTTLASFTAKCAGAGIHVAALQDDCQLRGIANPHQNIDLIDYHGLLERVISHSKQVAW